MRFLKVLLLLPAAIFANQHHDDIEPVNMSIEWVMQGYEFGFHGFMVEFLGFSSAIRKLLPQLRLVQSFFRETFADLPFKNETEYFHEQMFRREGDDALWLFKNHQPPVPIVGHRIPVSHFFPPSNVTQDHCNPLTPGAFADNKSLIGGELARPSIPSAKSAQSCCEACLINHLCVAWTFNQLQLACNLKGSQFEAIDAHEHVSGHFLHQPGGRFMMPRAVILHGTTCIHNNQTLSRRDANTIFIGRFMMERETLQKGASMDEVSVSQCAAIVDEVWVPTEWSKRSFEAMLKNFGYPNPQVFVVPEAVDTTLFDPALARPVSPSTRIDEGCIAGEAEGHVGEGSGPEGASPGDHVCVAAPKKFKFLSIFKWEHRKGWDILLDAYWEAFSATDAVVLQLRTYLPSFHMGKGNITEALADYAMMSRGKALDELAAVEWISGQSPTRLSEAMTRMDVRDLLASADAFVLPTRGEGWGLPVAEAMAMALPVIVTNYSGPTGYATDLNSYLIPVAPERDSLGFAKPSVSALVELMRQVVRDAGMPGGGPAAARGAMARQTMQELSPEHAVSIMAGRLREQALRRGWTEL